MSEHLKDRFLCGDTVMLDDGRTEFVLCRKFHSRRSIMRFHRAKTVVSARRVLSESVHYHWLWWDHLNSIRYDFETGLVVVDVPEPDTEKPRWWGETSS